ncbi:hypothetical protein BB561_000485 [Smittium simulii]|uniref:Uncharacterized protein n=1 Tax=Smittium simulii TaxID=133385 RepID=A0A2T9YZ10_9FUNG|nr:hypothetical protein BB561_000485 [Smittium simulii]
MFFGSSGNFGTDSYSTGDDEGSGGSESSGSILSDMIPMKPLLFSSKFESLSNQSPYFESDAESHDSFETLYSETSNFVNECYVQRSANVHRERYYFTTGSKYGWRS